MAEKGQLKIILTYWTKKVFMSQVVCLLFKFCPELIFFILYISAPLLFFYLNLSEYQITNKKDKLPPEKKELISQKY